VFVLGGIVLATLIRFPIQPAIQDASPFVLYFPVVVAVSILFGWRCGLLATALSVLPADYFWMAPYRTFAVDAGQVVHIIGFSFAGLSVSWLSEAARRRRQLEEHLCAAIANVGDAIVTTDCRGRIVYLNTVARLLTELHGRESVGCTFGSTVDLFAERGEHSLNGTFQVALSNDDIDNLPPRVIISSKSGKRHRVVQKTSRILNAKGEMLGMAILFHKLEHEEPELPARSATLAAAIAPALSGNEDTKKGQHAARRIAMVSIHGYVAAQPNPGAADSSGQVVYVLELSKKLAQLGYQVDVWTRRFEDQPEIEIVDPQVRIIRAACGGRNFIPKEFLCEYLQEWNENALKFINRHQLKYEFINSHYWDGGLAGDHLSRALGVLHFHTPHSLGIWMRRQSEADSAGRLAQARLDEEYNFTKRIASELSLYISADMIVATSPEQQGILVCDYRVPAEKCRMIPPGYDETRFYPVSDSARMALRKRLGFDAPVVQAVGRLTENNGYESLIRAFAAATRQMPQATLRLAVSDKTLTPQETAIFVRLRTLVSELDLRRKVTFGSFIPDDQLADYYRAADMVVLSSRYERFGIPAVEAIACGTPAVLAIHGGVYHTVTFGKHGPNSDPCAPEDLEVLILQALKDPGSHLPASCEGTAKARSLFAWSGVAQQLLALTTGRTAKP